MSKSEESGCSAIFTLLFYLFLFIGYVKCVVHLCQCDFQAPYKAEVLYAVGVVSPLGPIIGWLELGN